MPEKVFSIFDEIRKEIEDETDRVAGTNKGIISKPITLKIFSSRVVDLTLVDLPVITKVPIGDQPKDIEAQIKNMVLKYIKNEDSIILAVSAANSDIATSEALKIAKEIDPMGVRTLAVLTKLDLMDTGTDVVEVLSGRVIPVKLGFFGVVNRSQAEIDSKIDSDQQLAKEEAFLKDRYPDLAAVNGTRYLEQQMSELLKRHIHECLPGLKKRVLAETDKVQKQLDALGNPVEDKTLELITIIKNFSEAYEATIKGRSGCIKEKARCGPTRLYEILHDEFDESIFLIEFNVVITQLDLKALMNSTGPRPTLFPFPYFDEPFEEKVKKQIAQLQPPALECVDKIHAELKQNIEHCGTAVLQEMCRFPKLNERIVKVVKQLLNDRMKKAKETVKDVVAIELAYINQSHPDFNPKAALKGSEQLFKFSSSVNPSSLSQEDERNANILREIIYSYFSVVRKSFQDSVMKAIMHVLVNFVIENLHSELLTHVHNTGDAETLLSESEEVENARRNAKSMLDASLDAKIILTINKNFFSSFRL